jgi:glyoxylase-like metal-dependent hydrolase (beta-lactamase superfamily II)
MFFSSGGSIKSGRKVIDSLYYFAEQQMLDCNQYIINDEESEELVLFDAGNGKSLNGLFEGMEKLGLDPEHISKLYLTHEHVDHVLGVYTFLDKFGDDALEIFAYGRTAEILQQGKESEIFPGNLGISPRMFGVEICPIRVHKITKDDPVRIGQDYNFTIYHTPGHSQGSIVYYEPDKKILISGDLVFTGGSFGRYDFPGGSLSQLQDSIKFVNNLDVTYLLPGHMGISDNGNTQIAASNRMVHTIGPY